MKRRIVQVLLLVLLAIAALFAIGLARNWDTVQRVFLGGKKVYETTPPALPVTIARPAILVFSKTNAFRHAEAIPAANRLFADLARSRGWGYFATDNGAAFSPDILARFDAVIFNNVSGDVFTPDQRAAFKAFVERGGGFVGIHAAGDDSHKVWPWYQDEMIGARFTQHTMNPQFQRATVRTEDRAHAVTQGLPAQWSHVEEWYAFERSPRSAVHRVLIGVDEKSYVPEGMFGKDIAMGDHPMAWWRCMGRGRVFYTAFGHQAQAYARPEMQRLLANATGWAIGLAGAECGKAATAPAGPAR